MKFAAIEAMWHTEKAPAALTVFGIPNEETMQTDYAIEIPYVLGLIATRTFTQPLQGISELIEQGKERIKEGIQAYEALTRLQKSN